MWTGSLRINAWSGDEDAMSQGLHSRGNHWIGSQLDLPAQFLWPQPLVSKSDWTNEQIGWGLILPENLDLNPAERATAIDAPKPIQDLVAARGNAPVLRYREDLPKWAVRRYYNDGSCQDPSLVASKRGTGWGCIPWYLMIYGSPTQIPWNFQYRLNAVSYVGRLDLEGEALENYVNALLSEWNNSQTCVDKAVVWAVDHGGQDITRLMRRGIAAKIYDALARDPNIGSGAHYIDGSKTNASGMALIDALKAMQPALVVTTSHGMTGPLNNVNKMARQLGIPLDTDHQLLNIETLLQKWEPGGAIWYAHACCSAGSDEKTSYKGLVKEGSHIESILNGITAVGAQVAPLPKALLGAPNPLRAFIGHVEPTFDWTLQQQETKQLLTNSIINALYQHLYQPEPVGLAFEECHRHGPQLNTMHLQAKEAYARGEDARLEEALASRLMAVDRESLVLLGDPIVLLPIR